MTSATTMQLNPTNPHYPVARLSSYAAAPEALEARGELALLGGKLLGLFCSSRCPASLLLPAYDTAAALAAAGVAIVGGFHSPPEQGCLRLLLQGRGPVVICPARRLEGMRVSAAWQPALTADRLLLLSPFGQVGRITAETAAQRNRFVAALADELLILHAQPGGKTEQLCREALTWGKPIYTLAHPTNANLLALGAQEYPLPLTTLERNAQ